MDKKALIDDSEYTLDIEVKNGTMSESRRNINNIINTEITELGLPTVATFNEDTLTKRNMKFLDTTQELHGLNEDAVSDIYFERHDIKIHNVDLPIVTLNDVTQEFIHKHDTIFEEPKQQTSKKVHTKKQLPPLLANKLNTRKGNAKPSSVPFDYQVLQHFLGNRMVRCCKGMIFLYNEKFGCYEEQSEAELHVAIRKSLDSEMDMKLGKQKISDVVHRIISNPELQVNLDDFNKHTQLINFRNSVFSLDDKTSCPHSPDYLFTSYIDADYGRPQPRSSITVYIKNGTSAPKGQYFEKFLDDCTEGDLVKKKSLQQLTGYIISNEWRAKKFFILIGKPHTGKSVWLTLWQSLIGSKHTTAMSLKQLGESRFMTAELFHSKLNISAEMDENGAIKGTDILKSITGGDLITAEKKGKDPFQFYGKTKLVAAGNHVPLLNKLDGTSAFTDRILFLTFNNTIPEKHRDKSLLKKLFAEKEHIIQWAIEGLNELKSNNLIFSESDDAKDFKQQYVNELNNVPEFIRDKCDIDLNNDAYRAHRKDLYPAYTRFCHDNGSRAMSTQEFFVEVGKLNVKAEKFRMKGTTALWGFKGIKLKPIIDSEQYLTEEINTEEIFY